MPYIFTIQSNPTAGDIVSVNLTDGNLVQRTYSYTVLANDTLTDIVNGLDVLINADIYFTSFPQAVYPGAGLEINQVATVNFNLFSGFVSIVYSADSYSPPFTMVYAEGGSVDSRKNGFEGARSYHPDIMCCLGTLLVSWKNGTLWTHDSTVYNNWYGIQYESFIKVVFNENPLQKKTFMGITEVSSVVWDCPEIITNINAIQSLGVKQSSDLITQDFELIEGNYQATFRTDQNSISGNDTMKGVYMIIKFRAQNFQTSNFVYIALLNMRIIDSPLNITQ